MARIEGVDLPRNKRVEVGLTYIYGIGSTRSKQILDATGINPDTRVRELTEAEVQALREQIGNYRVEGELRREVQLNIKRLIEIGSYRGLWALAERGSQPIRERARACGRGAGPPIEVGPPLSTARGENHDQWDVHVGVHSVGPEKPRRTSRTGRHTFRPRSITRSCP